MNSLITSILSFVLVMFLLSCASNQPAVPHDIALGQPTYGVVTNAFNREDWDALRRLTKPGMRSNEYITKWESSGRAGQAARVGKLRNVKMDYTYNLDGKPCAEYSFALENKDGTLNPHWLQILVREEDERSQILDFWEFGW